MSGSTYWLTLAISREDLAKELGVRPSEVEDQDYLGGIREHGEIVKLEEVEDD